MASTLLRSFHARRAMFNPNLIKMMATRTLSSVPTKKVDYHGWKNYTDIPDSALPKSPDPTNGVYETEEYKKVQRKRIWYQIDDGTPIYFKEGVKDRVIVYTYGVLLASLLSYEYYLIITQVSV